MITKDKIQEILRDKGIALEKIASDPHIYDKACGIAYKAMPIPLRWFVGKKSVRKLLSSITEKIQKRGNK